MGIWSFIQEKLSENKAVMLLIVVQFKGSSPGKTGFQMAISSDGALNGSIGGGDMERELSNHARSLLLEGKTDVFMREQNHHGNDNEASGMICSGSQWVAHYPFYPKNTELPNQICRLLEEEKEALLVYSETGIQLQADAVQEDAFYLKALEGQRWELREQIGRKNTLYIFGGGHVGLALSGVCSQLGFQVEVFDDRPHLNTMENNKYAHKKHVLNYKDISYFVKEGKHIYAVIMTFSHRGDEVLLGQLLAKNIRYLGMMGSSKKVASIRYNLLQKGYTEAQLDRVYAPIGLPINSQTPNEISISVAAEIIKIKNTLDLGQ